jgi:hypothetical protein
MEFVSSTRLSTNDLELHGHRGGTVIFRFNTSFNLVVIRRLEDIKMLRNWLRHYA